MSVTRARSLRLRHWIGLLTGLLVVGGTVGFTYKAVQEKEARERVQAEIDQTLRAFTWMERSRKAQARGHDEQAFTYMLKAAEEGHTPAINSVADMYEEGIGVEQSWEKAEFWYSQSKPEVYLRFLNRAAFALYLGNRAGSIDLETETRLSMAVKFWEKAADKGDSTGWLWLGHAYGKGKGVEQDIPKAAEAYRKAYKQAETDLEKGGPPQGLLFLDNGRYEEEALAMLETLRSEGNTDGTLALAEFYFNHPEKPENYRRAAEIYKSLEGRSPHLTARLAHMYRTGLGVAQNPVKAFELFQSAADQGYPDALIAMGHMYRLGLGTEKNPDKALEIFEQATVLNRKRVSFHLGQFYEERGEWDAAIAAYQEGIGFEDADSFVGMARLYEKGRGVTPSESKAWALMKEGAERGSNLGRAAMADYYERGYGTQPNAEYAEIWRNKIALNTDVFYFEPLSGKRPRGE